MSLNKGAYIRYQVLDKCFRNTGKRFSIDDLVLACNETLQEHGIQGVKKRQIYNDISFMESEAGWSVEIKKERLNKKVYYRYLDPRFSIKNSPLNSHEVAQLKEAIDVLNRFEGLPQFDWIGDLTAKLETLFHGTTSGRKIIEFEQNHYLHGRHHIATLYHAILDKTPQIIKYQGFKQPEPKDFIFHPHFLKEYNNRWFVFGFHAHHTNVTNLALDRIINIEPAQGSYRDSTIDYTDYFHDVIGVTVPRYAKPEKVIIKVSPSTVPYIVSKPIHGSQKYRQTPDGEHFIELFLITENFELLSKLLSYGKGLKVIHPPRLKSRLEEVARFILSNE